MENRILKELGTVRMSWEVISILIDVEKIGSEWLALVHREYAILDTFKVVDPQKSQKIYSGIIETLTGNVEPEKVQALEDVKCLFSWFIGDNTVPDLIKSLVFKYLFSLICLNNEIFEVMGSELTTSLLAESGYSWVAYISISFPMAKEINGWLFSVLMDIHDRLQMLLHKIDLYGAGSKLNMREQLLIHIIDSHKGIGTKHLVKKLGRSEATVRRMLSKLRRLNFIESFGKGPSLSHRIMAR